MRVAWRAETCAHVNTHAHTNTHISQIKKQAASRLHNKKALFKNFTVVAKYIYLYSYHLATVHYYLAGDLVLINCQNVINYVKIVMYIQFGMLTWYKILVILFIL